MGWGSCRSGIFKIIWRVDSEPFEAGEITGHFCFECNELVALFFNRLSGSGSVAAQPVDDGLSCGSAKSAVIVEGRRATGIRLTVIE